jgi:aryl-alcohol dehydrogenase-like predicted oxidoreductase
MPRSNVERRAGPVPGAMTRRRFLALAIGAGGAFAAPSLTARRATSSVDPSMTTDASAKLLTRTIPSSGEALPALGLGTWRTFDVGDSDAERAPLREVLRRLFAAGGRVIDSSPMYGRAESVVGDLLRGTPEHGNAFIATKVWTTGRAEGIAEMEESERRMGGRIDLMQVHNLVDWRTHLPTLREWKSTGRIRYVGVTHYSLSAFQDLEQIVRKERVDFVQLPYSVAVRDAEKRLLPAARESGTAVLVMRPFESGSLLASLRSRPLPAFAKELGAASWAQLLLKFILSHPAVTAAIPATSKPAHLDDDLGGARGPLPDETLRAKIAAAAAA